MSEPSLITLAAAAGVAALVVGFLKTSVGGGIGLVLTPLLSLFLPAQVVLGLTAVQLNLSDPITLRYYWREWDGRQLRLMLPTLLGGILVGGWALSGLSDTALKKTIGATAFAGALIQLAILRRWLSLGGGRSHWSVASLLGLVAGVASAVAHSGGIVIGPYLVGLGLSNAAVVATGSALVAVSNVLKLITYWGIGFLSWPLAGVALLSTPVLYLGAWLGYRLNRWIPRTWFALALILIALVGSLRLLLA
ncbi:MAG: sulfite exporter TauE/SafE family protein [Candidatus Rokubacteria bacterium]|nr:sulfite exporter TauE/SafE family protein [Candidatus Rokubacteria bacterium]